MLYVVGGAARTGKSIIARRFLHETEIPYLSLDILMMGLAKGFPEHKIDPEDPDHLNPERMWPVVRNMSRNIIEAGLEYLIEGVSILPEHVKELLEFHPTNIRACFIGYTRVTPEDKLRSIRQYFNFPNNWSKGHSDHQLLDLINNEIKHSVRLQNDCSRYNITYFDQSVDFMRTVDAVVNYLKS